MYTLAVRRDFIARHYLIGGDWGPENSPHAHHYILELQLKGDELDPNGFLVDIIDVEKHLDGVIHDFKEQILNEKPEFAGLNPSLEHFSRILATSLNQRIKGNRISQLKVVLWEHENAWAAYRLERA